MSSESNAAEDSITFPFDSFAYFAHFDELTSIVPDDGLLPERCDERERYQSSAHVEERGARANGNPRSGGSFAQRRIPSAGTTNRVHGGSRGSRTFKYVRKDSLPSSSSSQSARSQTARELKDSTSEQKREDGRLPAASHSRSSPKVPEKTDSKIPEKAESKRCCVFEGRPRPKNQWKWSKSTHDRVKRSHSRKEMSQFHGLKLVWMTPMPSEPVNVDNRARELSTRKRNRLCEPSRVPQASRSASRYGEYRISFDREHVFAEYKKHIGERYVIYRVYDEFFNGQLSETYLVCPISVKLSFRTVQKSSLRSLTLPTAFNFIPGQPSHTWTNIRFCFAVNDALKLDKATLDFRSHERNIRGRPICATFKKKVSKCSNMTAAAAKKKYIDWISACVEESKRSPFEQANCSICLDTLGTRNNDAELNCGHKFHTKCILQWSETANVCPLCKERFREIKPLREGRNRLRVKRRDKRGNGAPSYLDDEYGGEYGEFGSDIAFFDSDDESLIIENMCFVCGSPDTRDQLLMCDVCGTQQHMFCCNPPLTQAPQRGWRCSDCESLSVEDRRLLQRRIDEEAQSERDARALLLDVGTQQREWHCGACTYINLPNAVVCLACDRFRIEDAYETFEDALNGGLQYASDEVLSGDELDAFVGTTGLDYECDGFIECDEDVYLDTYGYDFSVR